MPLGMTLLHSPGCNEGKARNETLGTPEKKDDELRQGAALTANIWFVSLRFVDLHSLRKYRFCGAQKMCGNN